MGSVTITIVDQEDGSVAMSLSGVATKKLGDKAKRSKAIELGDKLVEYLESISEPEDPNGTKDFTDDRD